jgi:uncharacterized BrkB/YihY/UPF0761 family membrane protein
MSDQETASDGSAHSVEANSPARPSSQPLQSIVGVFAGSARGSAIGGVVGTILCFGVMTVWAIGDESTRNHPHASRGTLLAAVALGILWVLLTSLTLGGMLGAFVGAMIGAFFPVRQGAGGSEVR